MVDIGRALLTRDRAVSRAVWKSVGNAFYCVSVDVERYGVAPLVCCTVEEVGAVVPQHGRSVVLRRSAQEEIKIAPACCCLGGYGGSGPFADDKGDVAEVTTDSSNISFERGFVGIGAPGCLAPGAEDEIILGS